MRKYASLIGFIILFEAIGGALGLLTAQEIESWYSGLAKSPYTPPDAAFGIVWPILYAMLAIAVWIVWQKPESAERKNILILFAAHMVLNWAWTPVFFTAHETLAGFIILVLIVATAIWLALQLWRLDRRAALLLVPYIAWVLFASHLNYYIWQNNA